MTPRRSVGLPLTGRLAGMPAGLLLDLDGTLVDSEPVHREAFRRFFAARGWECTDERLDQFTGRRADDVFATTPGPWSGLDPVALFHEVVAAMPHDVLPVPVPGAGELLDEADEAGIPYALVTSADVTWAGHALAQLGGLDRFTAVVTRADVTDGKPAPDGYVLGAARLGVAADECFAVEHTPAGVAAARAAGVWRVYGITTSFAAHTLVEAGATSTVGDLVGILQPDAPTHAGGPA